VAVVADGPEYDFEIVAHRPERGRRKWGRSGAAVAGGEGKTAGVAEVDGLVEADVVSVGDGEARGVLGGHGNSNTNGYYQQCRGDSLGPTTTRCCRGT